MNPYLPVKSDDERSVQSKRSGDTSCVLTLSMAREDQWDEAMDLAWRVFTQLPETKGKNDLIKAFNSFVTDPILHRAFVLGNYQLMVAMEGDKLVGMLTLREPCHISLLFVDLECQGKGVGRMLIYALRNYVLNEMGATSVTVDAAPWAVGFYSGCGFMQTGDPVFRSGISCVPMELVF